MTQEQNAVSPQTDMERRIEDFYRSMAATSIEIRNQALKEGATELEAFEKAIVPLAAISGATVAMGSISMVLPPVLCEAVTKIDPLPAEKVKELGSAFSKVVHILDGKAMSMLGDCLLKEPAKSWIKNSNTKNKALDALAKD